MFRDFHMQIPRWSIASAEKNTQRVGCQLLCITDHSIKAVVFRKAVSSHILWMITVWWLGEEFPWDTDKGPLPLLEAGTELWVGGGEPALLSVGGHHSS